MNNFNCSQCLQICEATCCSRVPIPVEIFRKHPVDAKYTIYGKDKPRHPDYGDGEYVIFEQVQCPYLTEDLRCGIHADRPDECREFGSEKNLRLTCPVQDKDGRIRTLPEIREIVNKQLDDLGIQIS